ncbi:DUF2235 domain-containing protein [Streptomyces sp. NPDC002088]|uniref:DUF2235 domain-containing protein n=1 Tax=Streptomyces sp. NPDC002088 TaxID=3154665 RepID=UPI0033313D06
MAKRLVICCDGTWNRADQPNRTNVAKVALTVRRNAEDGTEQRVYYHAGVGVKRWERLRGGAFGFGLSRHVLDAYRFLVAGYDPGDQLYLFGFSRGAFTARSLAGLVRNSGILRREHADRIEEAWALYRSRTDNPSSDAARLFRGTYAYETDIRFIGVWDTVGSLGIPDLGPRLPKWLTGPINHRWAFHDTNLSKYVNGAFQALAIDEERPPFQPTLWHQQPGAVERKQELRQVWFTGVHVDIGGGFPDTGLSDITLLWMVGHAVRYGLEFDNNPRFPAHPNPMAKLRLSREGLYRLIPAYHRPIGRVVDDKTRQPDGREYLAKTAKQRYDNRDTAYRPPQLTRYLDDFGGGHFEP